MMLFSILGLALTTTIFCNALPNSPAESSDTTPKITNNDAVASDVADRAQVYAIAADFRDNKGILDVIDSGTQGLLFIINEYRANKNLRTSVCNDLRWGWTASKSDISQDKTVRFLIFSLALYLSDDRTANHAAKTFVDFQVTCHAVSGRPPLSDIISVDSEMFANSGYNLYVIEQLRKFTWGIQGHLDTKEETFKLTCSLPEFTAFDTMSCTVESDG